MPQSLAKLWVHLIFCTKVRYPFLTDKSVRRDTHAYLATVLRSHDCETATVGGIENHVHALFSLSRNHSISDIVKEIKRTSSKWIKEKSAEQRKFYWQHGYGASQGRQSEANGGNPLSLGRANQNHRRAGTEFSLRLASSHSRLVSFGAGHFGQW